MLGRSGMPAGHFEQRDPRHRVMSGEHGPLHILNVITGSHIAI